jgi:hypothetical protein
MKSILFVQQLLACYIFLAGNVNALLPQPHSTPSVAVLPKAATTKAAAPIAGKSSLQSATVSLASSFTSPSGTPLPNGANATDILKFDPPVLKLSPSMAAQNFSVSLKEAPKSVVVITFETNEYMRLDRCQLIFSPQNFSQPQPIRVYAAGDVLTNEQTKSFKTEIKARVRCNCNADRSQSIYPVEREFKKSRVCASNGDPHYLQFNGVPFTYMGSGEKNYYMVKSKRFSVVTHLRTCNVGLGARCNDALGIRFMDTVMKMSVKQNAAKDPAYILETFGPASGITVTKQNPSSVEFKTEDGATVSVTIHHTGASFGIMLDISVQVPGFYAGMVDGLCGTFSVEDNQQAQNKQEADKNSLDAKYTVPENENILACNNQCPGIKNSLANSAGHGQEKFGLECAASDANADAVLNQQGRVNQAQAQDVIPENEFRIRPAKIPKNGPGESNEAYCKRIFSNLKCGKLDGSFHADACAQDCKISGKCELVARPLMQTFQREVSFYR